MKTYLKILFFFLLVTQICFAQWGLLGLEDKSIRDIAASNATIFAITSENALHRSTDNGITWLQIVDSNAVDIVIAPTGNVFMVRKFSPHQLYNTNDSLFISSDNGNTWVNLDIMNQLSSLPGYSSTKVTISPLGTLYCGISYSDKYSRYVTIALSTNDGSIWTSPGEWVPGGDLFDFVGESIITAGHEHAIDVGSCNVSLSLDNGQTWSILGSSASAYNTVLGFYSNGKIIMGGPLIPLSDFLSGLIISNDSCTTWKQVSMLDPVTGISVETCSMLVGTDSLGVFLFSDNGDSLGSFNEGLSDLNSHILSRDNNGYVYLGTSNGVWRRPLSEITSIEELSTNLPLSFNLSQNYPNPFNSSCAIKYSVPKSSNVIIKIFNVLGSEIETLINEEKYVGTYELNWNAANLPSGVYFYRLQTGSFGQTRKMLLLK